jgi:excisionase family DNA binding protein
MEQMYYTVQEIALLLRLSNETIREKLRNKKMDGIKIGKSWRITEANFKKFIGDWK